MATAPRARGFNLLAFLIAPFGGALATGCLFMVLAAIGHTSAAPFSFFGALLAYTVTISTVAMFLLIAGIPIILVLALPAVLLLHRWQARHPLIYGVAGLGIGLLTALYYPSGAWDEAFLCLVPPFLSMMLYWYLAVRQPKAPANSV